MLLINKDQIVSAPFKIPYGKQLTLLATGLNPGETVGFEILSLTVAGPAGDVCCPGLVNLPDIDWTAPLKVACGCEEPALVELTSDMPYVILNYPQQIFLRAKVDAEDDAVVEVHLYETASHA